MTNIESADHQNIEGQTTPATQNLTPLSLDPTREIILKNKNDNTANQTNKQNNDNDKRPIQEEWILPDKILPNDKWEFKSKFEYNQNLTKMVKQAMVLT